MANSRPSFNARHEQLLLLESCLETLNQMALCLTQHDLLGLERSLEEGTRLVSQLVRLQKAASGQEELSFQNVAQNKEVPILESQELPIGESLRHMARQIRAAATLNLTLIDNGSLFSHTVLNAIYPSSNYRPSTSSPPALGAEFPVQPRISLQS